MVEIEKKLLLGGSEKELKRKDSAAKKEFSPEKSVTGATDGDLWQRPSPQLNFRVRS